MPYVKVENRYERIDMRTTGKIKKMLAEISKADHRSLTNEIELLIIKRHEELKKG